MALGVGAWLRWSGAPRWAFGRMAVWLGERSFGIYLWHFPVIQACVATGLLAWSVWLGALTALSVAVILAWASWRLIEAPALRHR